jgi:hypothetical protein
VTRVAGQAGVIIYDVTRHYLTEPSIICSEVLSCSIISQNKKCLYDNMCFGFVLSVPKYNICNAATTDLVAAPLQGKARAETLHGLSKYYRTGKVTEFLSQLAGKAKRNIPAPSTVLAGTSDNGHNEVIVLGTFLSQVAVSALFVKVSHGKLWQAFIDADADGAIRRLMLTCARTLAMPIIAIPDDSGRASSVDFDVWIGKNVPPIDPGVVESDSRALMLARPDPIVRDDAPNLKLTFGKARALLARELNVSVFTELRELHKLYLRLALTHHPDKTDDEDKRKKFVFVRGLLVVVEDFETSEGVPKAISL